MSWQLILMDDATSPSSTGQGVTYTTTEIRITWQNALVANVVKEKNNSVTLLMYWTWSWCLFCFSL